MAMGIMVIEIYIYQTLILLSSQFANTDTTDRHGSGAEKTLPIPRLLRC